MMSLMPDAQLPRRIAVVEDDPECAALIALALRETLGRCAVREFPSAERALEGLSRRPADLAIVDLGLPGEGGRWLLSRLKADPATKEMPVIILTAAEPGREIEACLREGAADYQSKPIDRAELGARALKALGLIGGVLRRGPLALDPAAHRATLDGGPLELTPKEFALLEQLMRAEGKLVAHETLLDRVWGRRPEPAAKLPTDGVHVHNLRNKLGKHKDLIRCVDGVGFELGSP